MDDLPVGWKKGATSTENDSLFKVYKTGNIDTAFDYLYRIKQTVLDSDFRGCTFITLSSDFLTITINDLGDKKPLEAIIAFAKDIDLLIEV
ncbi:MAG: hypothetical protein U5L95_04970 [Candidatus Saccharibacteria bacterium]|nr:hypothetical protein [Candidatus Saccharibacteria bacterium]